MAFSKKSGGNKYVSTFVLMFHLLRAALCDNVEVDDPRIANPHLSVRVEAFKSTRSIQQLHISSFLEPLAAYSQKPHGDLTRALQGSDP